MPELSRSQIAVYGAVAVALLLLGARAIRAEGSDGSSYGSSSFELRLIGDGGGGFTLDSSGSGGDVVVDVTGAVARPGVYRLPAGSRVTDAVEPGRRGDRRGLAGSDQPRRAARRRPAGGGAEAGARRGAACRGRGGAKTGPISLGTATVEQLDTIDGIGPVTAQKIVEFRDQQGGLASVDQLDQVSGIGPATMESLRARLQP